MDWLGKPRDLRYLVSATTETATPKGITRWKGDFESPGMGAELTERKAQVDSAIPIFRHRKCHRVQ